MRAPKDLNPTAAEPAEWTFADAWETIADAIPNRVALAHGDRRITWREFDRRAERIAAALLDKFLASDQSKLGTSNPGRVRGIAGWSDIPDCFLESKATSTTAEKAIASKSSGNPSLYRLFN